MQLGFLEAMHFYRPVSSFHDFAPIMFIQGSRKNKSESGASPPSREPGCQETEAHGVESRRGLNSWAIVVAESSQACDWTTHQRNDLYPGSGGFNPLCISHVRSSFWSRDHE